MLKIDIHTHILPKDLPKWKDRFGYGGFIQLHHHQPCCARMLKDDGTFFREISHNCWDEKVRLQEYDSAGVQVQVLSTVPVMFNYWANPEHGNDIARFLNDHLATIVQQNKKRFVGLGTVPLQDTNLAITEMQRCVQELGLRGIQIGSNVNGKNLDHEDLFPFFQEAEKLQASIFVHPWDMLSPERMQKFWFPWLIGMPTEVTLAIGSMIFGGVLEKLPKLKIAFAHGGGAFPGTYSRLKHGFLARPDLVATQIQNNPDNFLKKIYVDSLVHDKLTFQFLLQFFGAKQIAMGTDYPFPLGESSPGSLIDSLSGISVEDKKRLLHGTALEWLGMKEADFI